MAMTPHAQAAAIATPAAATMTISAACVPQTIHRAQPILNMVSISPRRRRSDSSATNAINKAIAPPASKAWASKNRFTRKTRSSVSEMTWRGSSN